MDATYAVGVLQGLVGGGSRAQARTRTVLEAGRAAMDAWLASSLASDDVVVETLCKQGFALATPEVPFAGDGVGALGAVVGEVGAVVTSAVSKALDGEGRVSLASWARRVGDWCAALVAQEGIAWCAHAALIVQEVR
jgi:hypothetical protein